MQPDTKNLRAAAEEVKAFLKTFGSLSALGTEMGKVADLEDRAASAQRTLAAAEARHEAILKVASVEDLAAAAEKNIAELTRRGQVASDAKEATEKSLATAKEELKAVTEAVAPVKKQLTEIQAKIREIAGVK